MIKQIIFVCSIAFITCCVSASEQNALVHIETPPENLFIQAREGNDPFLKNIDSFIIIGTINLPSFLIKKPENIAITDASGNTIPIRVEKSSIYSEFDDEYINAMRIAFTIEKGKLGMGSPKLVWSESIEGKYSIVEKIDIYKNNENQYRTFTLEEGEPIDDMSYATTIDVIVDDYADIYYLWYLMPIAIICVLLFIRRFFR